MKITQLIITCRKTAYNRLCVLLNTKQIGIKINTVGATYLNSDCDRARIAEQIAIANLALHNRFNILCTNPFTIISIQKGNNIQKFKNSKYECTSILSTPTSDFIGKYKKHNTNINSDDVEKNNSKFTV